jgi:hypothetical protein
VGLKKVTALLGALHVLRIFKRQNEGNQSNPNRSRISPIDIPLVSFREKTLRDL